MFPHAVFCYSRLSWKNEYFNGFLFLVGTVLGGHASCPGFRPYLLFGHDGELQFSSVPIFVEVTTILCK